MDLSIKRGHKEHCSVLILAWWSSICKDDKWYNSYEGRKSDQQYIGLCFVCGNGEFFHVMFYRSTFMSISVSAMRASFWQLICVCCNYWTKGQSKCIVALFRYIRKVGLHSWSFWSFLLHSNLLTQKIHNTRAITQL